MQACGDDSLTAACLNRFVLRHRPLYWDWHGDHKPSNSEPGLQIHFRYSHWRGRAFSPLVICAVAKCFPGGCCRWRRNSPRRTARSLSEPSYRVLGVVNSSLHGEEHAVAAVRFALHNLRVPHRSNAQAEAISSSGEVSWPAIAKLLRSVSTPRVRILEPFSHGPWGP